MLPAQVRKLREMLLTRTGVTSKEDRQQIEAYAAGLCGVERSATTLPAAIKPFVDKVAKHAYKVTDSDIAALKAAGYSEDAIFEITVSATLGASSGRFERGLALLRGGVQ